MILLFPHNWIDVPSIFHDHNVLKDLFVYKGFWYLKFKENLFIEHRLINNSTKKYFKNLNEECSLISKKKVPCDRFLYLKQSWKEQVAWFLWLSKNNSQSVCPTEPIQYVGSLKCQVDTQRREPIILKRMTFSSSRQL